MTSPDVPQPLHQKLVRSERRGAEGEGQRWRVLADPTPPVLQAQASDSRRRFQDSEQKSGIVREVTGANPSQAGGTAGKTLGQTFGVRNPTVLL